MLLHQRFPEITFPVQPHITQTVLVGNKTQLYLSIWFQKEETAERQVAGRSTAMKEITIEDSSGRAKVALWRKSTEYEARVGDHVNVTNLVINNYRGQVSLSGTGQTLVKVVLQFIINNLLINFLIKINVELFNN